MISVGCNKTQISEETTQSNEIVLKTTNSDLESLLISNSFDKKDEAVVASAFQNTNTNATILFDYPENQPNMPEKGFLRFTFK